MKKPFVITIDKDVAIPGEDSIYACHAEKLKSMQPGDSFFIPGAELRDVAGLVAYADFLEIPLTIVPLLRDEIYLTGGVRIWYGHGWEATPAFGKFAEQTIGQVSEALGINKEDLKADIEKPSSRGARYWHHPESSSVFAVAGNEPDPVTDDGCLEKITLDEYMRLSKEYSTAAFVQKIEETPEQQRYIGANHESWWKLKSGKMVEVDYEGYEKMSKDKNVTRVAYSDFRLWKERQDEEL